jgi:glycosyltransferase involved in cell wall biosynthesis
MTIYITIKTMIVEPLDFVVLIPCYNNPAGLRKSLQSVVYPLQRYGLLIIDDGSDLPLKKSDLGVDLPPETEIVRLSANAGITAALNAGLRRIVSRRDCRFVARLDCGDICAADRFVKQVDFLLEHPEVDLLGTWVNFNDVAGRFLYKYTTPVTQKEIERGMHFRNLFIHPSVMWRASALTRVTRYPYNLPYAEDYGFFCQLLQQGQAAILPEALVTCELNPNGISLTHRRLQLKSRMKAVLHYRRNIVLGLLGTLKLQLMQVIPYRTILRLKMMLD